MRDDEAERLRSMLVRFARKQGAADAEDVAHDVLATALGGKGLEGLPVAYWYVAVRNRIITQARRKLRPVPLTDEQWNAIEEEHESPRVYPDVTKHRWYDWLLGYYRTRLHTHREHSKAAFVRATMRRDFG